MKKITMLVIAAIIILSAIGCAAPAPAPAPTTAAEAPAADKTPIKLGWLGALSGDGAT